MNKNGFLQEMLTSNSFRISDVIQEKILHYLQLMQDWNRVYNLTAITEWNPMILLHILDSLSIDHFLAGKRILDIGTGAGLPGIPLALLHPEYHFVLLDSNSKKTRFLTQVKIELALDHLEVVHRRVEDFHPDQTFDSILVRAFASLHEMLSVAGHLLNSQGQFLAMKGVYPEQELQNVQPEFEIRGVHQLIIKGLDAERHLVRLGRNSEHGKNNCHC